MFSARCTNPSCASPFDYRRGRFFLFHDDHPGDGTLRGSHGVRHVWLCDPCSQAYTLHYEEGSAVLLRLEWQCLSRTNNHALITAA
jgi:hypothetical protein